MRIAFDFDGIFTDLSPIRRVGLVTHEYLYSPVSIAMTTPRRGIVELLSLFGLLADIVVLSARPKEDHSYIEEWLRRYRLRTLVSEVLCCEGASKVAVMKDRGIDALVDDELREVSSASSEYVGILWDHDDWLPVARELLSYLVTSQRATIRSLDDVLLADARLITDWGGAEVFLLSGNNGHILKVRVCAAERDRDRIVSFLRQAEASGYPHVARLVDVRGTAVLKTFLSGSRIDEWDSARRVPFLAKTGVALAKLHALPCPSPIYSSSLRLNDEPECLLVCSADEQNMIVTPADDVAFVDLGACASGARWVDLCWASTLLCRDAGEVVVLEEAYSAASGGLRAGEEEMASARRVYQLWLTTQLMEGLDRHRSNQAKCEAMRRTLMNIWRAA